MLTMFWSCSHHVCVWCSTYCPSDYELIPIMMRVSINLYFLIWMKWGWGGQLQTALVTNTCMCLQCAILLLLLRLNCNDCM